MVSNKNLVGYCGLYCGGCIKYMGKVSKFTIQLREALINENHKRVISSIDEIENYNDFLKTLDIIADLNCTQLCREGGGKKDCEVKTCCQSKGYETCAECEDFLFCIQLAGIPVLMCGNVSYVKELKQIRELGLDKWLEEKTKDS